MIQDIISGKVVGGVADGEIYHSNADYMYRVGDKIDDYTVKKVTYKKVIKKHGNYDSVIEWYEWHLA